MTAMPSSRVCSAILAVCLCSGGAIAAPHAPTGESRGYSSIERRTYFFKEAGAASEYLIYVSSRYRPGVPAPLIVALHGSGSSPTEIIRVQGFTGLAEQRGYILVAPWGLNDHSGYGNHGTGRSANHPEDPDNAGELSELDVMHVLAIVRNDYSIDPRHIYLLGHSMGGGGALYLGSKYPDIWAGLALVASSSGSATESQLRAIRAPIIIIHGLADDHVRVSVSRKLVEMLDTLDKKYRYFEIPGADHSSVIGYMPDNIRKIFDYFEEKSAAR